jgi:hypothetical protein
MKNAEMDTISDNLAVMTEITILMMDVALPAQLNLDGHVQVEVLQLLTLA